MTFEPGKWLDGLFEKLGSSAGRDGTGKEVELSSVVEFELPERHSKGSVKFFQPVSLAELVESDVPYVLPGNFVGGLADLYNLCETGKYPCLFLFAKTSNGLRWFNLTNDLSDHVANKVPFYSASGREVKYDSLNSSVYLVQVSPEAEEKALEAQLDATWKLTRRRLPDMFKDDCELDAARKVIPLNALARVILPHPGQIHSYLIDVEENPTVKIKYLLITKHGLTTFVPRSADVRAVREAYSDAYRALDETIFTNDSYLFNDVLDRINQSDHFKVVFEPRAGNLVERPLAEDYD
ncbi:hypothetical protein COV18_00355 [Candidatus Woesearchaeota archaeon CG10_big_fil_rev_8_21_14_0_10_37_12]|nr:MAG: hypothetical protein COV18_00355 [Candidatus Woesearchaeota archaeon CG10_big_fil_rev_8_21_14_0_10_37_12]